MPELIYMDGALGMVLLGCAMALPMLFGLLGLFHVTADLALKSAPIAVLPSLALSIGTPVVIDLPGFLLGSRFATGGPASVWLFVTSVLWFSAAWFGAYYFAEDRRRGYFVFFFLGSMLGNVGLIVARDPALFLAFFALMSFMSYGLVVHDRNPESMRAGRVYLSMAVLGEVLQFAGLSLVAFEIFGKGEPLLLQSMGMLEKTGKLSSILFLGGFGIKAGLLGLHMWLPMAHPVAPTPASAVLSGSMIKAGLIGWINFLPLGVMAMNDLGTAVLSMGLAGALAAALAGSVQKQAKAVLAYSSVSQMGLIITVFGLGLKRPEVWSTLLWVVIVYAAHHAFSKCLLFLSVGIKATRPLGRIEAGVFWSGTGVAALALAGAPATSGMAAKLVLKDAVETAAPVNMEIVLSALTVAAVGTTVLMARFIDSLRQINYEKHHVLSRGIYAPWLLVLSLVCVFAWYLAALHFPASIAVWKKAGYLLEGIWPVAAGVALYLAGKKIGRALPGAWQVPLGDIYIPLASLLSGIIRFAAAARGAIEGKYNFLRSRIRPRFRLYAKRMVQMASLAEDGFAVWRFGAAVVVATGASFFWILLG